MLREYIVSEAMFALGVPTTRSLAAATTGERVFRERALPGGVLMRVAQSHIRIGTLEYFASRGDTDGLQLIVDHVIARHYADLDGGDTPAVELLQQVVKRQARLVAQWQLLGFIHGVMNTNNVLLSGETIDYGPCAFIDEYDAETVFSSIDRGGRYAYDNQPRIMHWNLGRLGRALVPLFAGDDEVLAAAQAALDSFPALFDDAYQSGMARKLGLSEIRGTDEELINELLELMQKNRSDFTLVFRRLTDLTAPEDGSHASVAELYPLPECSSRGSPAGERESQPTRCPRRSVTRR